MQEAFAQDAAIIITAGISFHNNYAKWEDADEDPELRSGY